MFPLVMLCNLSTSYSDFKSSHSEFV